MSCAALHLPFARTPVPDDPLPSVLELTETSFVEAGNSLAHAVETLNGTKTLFARLDETLGDQTGRDLGQLIAATFGNVEGVRADFDAFLRQNLDLRAAVRGVRVDVGELDKVVRTISSVSTNARILGNALMPPRPQVNSFIERLAQMSSEAETILREDKDAVSGIAEDLDMMDHILQDLRQDLMQRVLPSLAHFAAIAQKVQDGRAEMTEVSADLAAQMKTVFSEVSRLITALQTGDSTRQRLHRVQDVLAAVSAPGHDDGNTGLDAVLVDLARALVEGTRADAQSEIDVSIAALETVQQSAEHAIQSARQFYFTQAGRGSDGSAVADMPEKPEESLDRVRRHLVAMRERAEVLGTRLDLILQHEAAIRQIAQHVRLSGLNAVLICAKLGEEGRSLREVAQWLRALTDESDIIVVRLQGNLATTRICTDAAGKAGVDRLEQALSGFMTDVEALNLAMTRISSTVTETAQGFDAAGRQLPVQIGQAKGRLVAFRSALGDLGRLWTTLGLRAAQLKGPAHPFAAGSDAATVLAQQRARYTMQQERAIHDAVLAMKGHDVPQATTAVPAPMPPAALSVQSATDDMSLDDILF